MTCKMLYIRLLLVLVISAVCQGQDGTFKAIKVAEKKGKKFLLAKCLYRIEEPLPGIEFNISLDMPTSSFRSKIISVTSNDGNIYEVKNKRDVLPKKFNGVFRVMFTGEITPTATCSSLRILTPPTLPNTFEATVLRTWVDNGLNRSEAVCRFNVEQSYQPRTKQFLVEFDTVVTKFEHWTMKNIVPTFNTGRWFHMTNKHWLHAPTYEFFFQASYEGDIPPTIICSSELSVAITTTTTTTTTTAATTTTTKPPTDTPTDTPTTTQPTSVETVSEVGQNKPNLPYTFDATITNTWPENGLTRLQGICTFAVDKTYQPETNDFVIDFGVNVEHFEKWVGKDVYPLGSSGSWFHMTNLHWIHPDKLEFSFHASYSGDKPTIECSSSLPKYSQSTVAPTTTQGPATTTKGPVTTTQGPATTTKGPVTTTQGPETTTKGPVTTTQGPATTTKGPVTTTQGPATTTKGPVTTTQGPATTTKGPVTTTQGPATTTKGPVTTTQGPTTTTKGPVTTTQGPETTTKDPVTTTQGPETTTLPPDGSYNYNEVLKKSIWFYRAQRSGDLPEVINDPVPWRGDSALYDGQDVGRDLTGGWYDAGDWVKFNFPISSAAAVLGWGLVQWKDAYVAAGQYTNMLDSIKWPLDFFIKCWDEGKEELYGQVGNGKTDHDRMMRPEEMTPSNMPRPAYKVTSAQGGSDLAGSMVAAFAAGAIAFKDIDGDYSDKLIKNAESLYDFADKYRAKYTVEITDAATYYPSSSYKDELVYAAAMLYKATGNSKYLDDAEDKYAEFGFNYQTSWAFDWSDKLMAAKLLLFEATGDSKYSRDVKTFLKEWAPGGSVQYTPGGLAWRLQWGSLRYSANAAFIALMAADLGIDTDSNKDWAEGQIKYMLGDNPRGSSYVVGFGNNPPKQPHHKSSVCAPDLEKCDWGAFSDTSKDNYFTLYGALVGGPDASDNYVDLRTDYVMAEVTCDYNAGFQSAIAGLIHFKNN